MENMNELTADDIMAAGILMKLNEEWHRQQGEAASGHATINSATELAGPSTPAPITAPGNLAAGDTIAPTPGYTPHRRIRIQKQRHQTQPSDSEAEDNIATVPSVYNPLGKARAQRQQRQIQLSDSEAEDTIAVATSGYIPSNNARARKQQQREESAEPEAEDNIIVAAPKFTTPGNIQAQRQQRRRRQPPESILSNIHMADIRDVKDWPSAALALSRLPAQREVEKKRHEFRDKPSVNLTAVVGQCVGVEAPQPCTRCERGNGPFTGGCIVVPPDADVDLNYENSCFNCRYQKMYRDCSLAFQ
ncbi:hypothetical protein SAMD00023353_6300120 [Rosellinia necatrix]|uniref:Uncharacterized protein n=1 Tax=Rosellinia necatrix TaxID=77044 RepID=A0A1W2TS72_ROSNE|nr:hypothetical protein SAMD00023353_6300120 [Rosellinia necatrix]